MWKKLLLGSSVFALCAALGFFGLRFFGEEGASPMNPSQADAREVFRHIYLYQNDDGYGSNGLFPMTIGGESAVWVAGDNVNGTVEVSLYRADESTLLHFLMYSDDDGRVRQYKLSDISRLAKVASLDVQIETAKRIKATLPIKEKGVWLVRAKQGDVVSEAIFLASNLGVVAKEGDNELVFWAQDMKNGRSVEGATVSLFNLRDHQEQLDEKQTDSSGITRTKLVSDADIAVVEKDGDRSVVPLNLSSLDYRWATFTEKTVSTKYFTYTDRPLYRPQDTIHFKSILRDDDDARYSVPNGEATVSVYTGWGDERKVVYERQHPISVFGAVDGTVTLPADAGPGEYYLQVSRNKNERSGWWYDSYTYFSVAEFRKPEYEVSVSVGNDEYFVGDRMEFMIEGKYFSGQPVSGGEVKYTLTSSNFYEYQYASDRRIMLDDRYRYGSWGGSEVTSGRAILDENGKAGIGLDAIIPEAHRGENQVFSLEVTMDIGGGEQSFDRKNLIVYAGDFGIYQDGYLWGAKINEKAKIPLKAMAYRDGANVSGLHAKVTGERMYWEEVLETESVPFHYESKSEPVQEFEAVSSSDGAFAVEFTPEKPGSYQFTIETQDARGNAVSRDISVWVSEDDGFYYSYDDGGEDPGITIKTDKESYEPGETANLSLSATVPNRDVLVTIERGRMERFFVVKMTGRNIRYPVRLGEEDMPNVFAAVSTFANGKFFRSETKLPVSAERKRINLRVIPDQETYGPGDDISFLIETTNRDGKPIQADASLSVVDKALFELTDQRMDDIYESFYHDRYNDTQDAHSLQGIVMFGAERGGCFASGTEVRMADGSSKPIEDVRIGDLVLTRKSEQDASLVSARVSTTHEIGVSGILVLNGSLRVTPEHRLFSNGEWKAAGDLQIGDILVHFDGTEETVDTIEWVRGLYRVYNLTIEDTHTYFAGGVWVHNSKDGGGRSVFRDTAYWNPSIQTGADGKARVTFRLPDNLTTWAFASYAVTKDTMVGQMTGEVIVTKKVILRPTIPDRLRVGDRAVISTLLQNFSGKDGNFSLSFSFDAGRIEEGAHQNVSLAPNESKEVFFAVVPERESEKTTFVFSAKGGEDDQIDAVTLSMPVIHAGYWIDHSSVGSSMIPTQYVFDSQADKGRSTLNVSISPSLLGTLPDSMRYLVDYPYGCMEQTMSRLMPSIIARKYPELFRGALEGKDMREILAKGIRRLKEHQLDNGGFPWWWNEGADPFISWYVSEYLSGIGNAPELSAGEKSLAAEMLEKLHRYVSFGEVKWPERAFIGKDDLGKAVLVREREALQLAMLSNLAIENQQIVYFEGMRPDILAISVRHNIRNGYRDPARNGLNQLLSQMKEDASGGVFWEAGPPSRFGSREASTALAADAILLAGDSKNIAERAIRYLNTGRRWSYWSNTFTTTQVMQAIASFSEKRGGVNPDYSYEILAGGKPMGQGMVRGLKERSESRVSLSELSGNAGVVEARTDGKGEAFLVATTREFHQGNNFSGESNGISVLREYLPEDGKKDIGMGDVIRVRLTVDNRSEVSDYLVIQDQLPASMVAVNRSFKNTEGIERMGNEPYGIEINDGTVTFSVVSMSKGVRTYEYLARVVSAGEYFVPPAKVEMMYAPEVNGLSASERISVQVKSSFEKGEAAHVASKAWGKKIAGVAAIALAASALALSVWSWILRKRRLNDAKPTDNNEKG